MRKADNLPIFMYSGTPVTVSRSQATQPGTFAEPARPCAAGPDEGEKGGPAFPPDPVILCYSEKVSWPHRISTDVCVSLDGNVCDRVGFRKGEWGACGWLSRASVRPTLDFSSGPTVCEI